MNISTYNGNLVIQQTYRLLRWGAPAFALLCWWGAIKGKKIAPQELGGIVDMMLLMLVSGCGIAGFLTPYTTTIVDPSRCRVLIKSVRPGWSQVEELPFHDIAEVVAQDIGSQHHLYLRHHNGVRRRIAWAMFNKGSEITRLADELRRQIGIP